MLAASDVVLEVLDARDPQGCRSPQLEAAVRQSGQRQRLVLVLNKIGTAWGEHRKVLGGPSVVRVMRRPLFVCIPPHQTWCRGTWWPRG